MHFKERLTVLTRKIFLFVDIWYDLLLMLVAADDRHYYIGMFFYITC